MKAGMTGLFWLWITLLDVNTWWCKIMMVRKI